MSHNSILKKLQDELQLDVTTERQVVYILAEIRKAVEQAGELEKYRALDFYCSFALHTRMSRIGAKRILERFDKAHPLLVKDQELPQELQQEIDRTIKFKRFQDELKAFLTVNGLPVRLLTDSDAWPRFIHLYGNIIDECELVLRADGVHLQYLDRVVVHLETAPKVHESEYGNQLLFRICWRCYGKDGTCGDHFVLFGYDPAL
jgi:hypothetical protein